MLCKTFLHTLVFEEASSPLFLTYCRIDIFGVFRKSFSGKFQIVCGFWNPANPAFRMYGEGKGLATTSQYCQSCFAVRFPEKGMRAGKNKSQNFIGCPILSHLVLPPPPCPPGALRAQGTHTWAPSWGQGAPARGLTQLAEGRPRPSMLNAVNVSEGTDFGQKKKLKPWVYWFMV